MFIIPCATPPVIIFPPGAPIITTGLLSLNTIVGEIPETRAFPGAIELGWPGIGLKQLLAGVRKFRSNLIDRDDIAYISQRAKEVCEKWDLGIKSQESLDFELVKKEIYSGNY